MSAFTTNEWSKVKYYYLMGQQNVPHMGPFTSYVYKKRGAGSQKMSTFSQRLQGRNCQKPERSLWTTHKRNAENDRSNYFWNSWIESFAV